MKTTLFLFLVVMSSFHTAFAMPAQCHFKDATLPGVDSIELGSGFLIINNSKEIPLSESQISCGVQGIKSRLDGQKEGYQIVLKSCSYTGNFEGYIFDSRRQVSADVECELLQE